MRTTSLESRARHACAWAGVLLGLVACSNAAPADVPDDAARAETAVTSDTPNADAPNADAPPADAPPADDGTRAFAGVVRLVAPLSTAAVTSRRPTLRWALAAGATGARV